MRMFRPAEWVALVFFLSCALRLAWAGGVSSEATNWLNFPRADILFSILAVLVLKLVRAHRAPHPALLPSLLLLTVVTMYGFRPEAWMHGGRYFLLALLGSSIAVIGGRVHGVKHSPFGIARYAWASAWLLASELRRWLPLFMLVCFYPLVPMILQHSAIGDQDVALSRLDTALFFGHNPLVLFEGITTGWLSEWLAFCYTSYVYIFLGVLALLYVKDDRKPFDRLVFALTLTLALGYVGYTLVPAQGPVFTQRFNVSLDLYYLKDIKEALMDRTRIQRDCFPSLHTAVTLVLLWSARREARPVVWALAVVGLMIPVACVYLRYHYVVDVLAGIALFAGVAWSADKAHPLI